MTSLPERQNIVKWICKAVEDGARRNLACEEIGISLRTLQRWTEDGDVGADARPGAVRPAPCNKLTEEERQQILDECNKPEHASLPPSQIVPKLADQGVYIASEASFYRILKAADQQHERGRAQKRRATQPPTTHVAKAPNEVWMWDVTYLPSRTRGLFYYLYSVEDLCSRKSVAWEVHESESGEHAAALMTRAVLREKCFRKPLVLHSDNGSPMKSQTLQAKLYELGIQPSHSRPRVSNDNAYVESFFRTMKYSPQWPSQGFVSLDEARHWVERFMRWYNEEHRHSAIKFVTPAQRHRGEDIAILAERQNVYTAAKARHPARWSGATRNWTPVSEVALNPRRPEQEKEAA